MTHVQTPVREEPLGGDGTTTPWATARDRLDNPDRDGHGWLATVRPDGRPHLMPVIAFWIEGALHFVAGEGTQKGRNLAAEARCMIGMENTTLPSLDIVAEGRAEPVSDPESVRRLAEELKAHGWPLEARGGEVHGPNAPSAGPPPYRIYRMVPSRAFGLPGTHGMDQVKPEDLPKPTRWVFAEDM